MESDDRMRRDEDMEAPVEAQEAEEVLEQAAPEEEERKRYYSPAEVRKNKGCIGCGGAGAVIALITLAAALIALL